MTIDRDAVLKARHAYNEARDRVVAHLKRADVDDAEQLVNVLLDASEQYDRVLRAAITPEPQLGGVR
jgi:hypothetical protein